MAAKISVSRNMTDSIEIQTAYLGFLFLTTIGWKKLLADNVDIGTMIDTTLIGLLRFYFLRTFKG